MPPTIAVVDWAWVIVLAGYAIGLFPTAHLVGRAVHHDPTVEGSGNPGASNMFRVAGKFAGALVLVGDTAKGVVATLLGLVVDGRPLGAACGAAAMLGHIFPITRRFRGGKGVATFGGTCLVLWTWVALAALGIWILLVKVTHKPSIGSLIGVCAVIAGTAIVGRPGWEVAFAGGLVAVIVARHADNIRRLLRREEKVLG